LAFPSAKPEGERQCIEVKKSVGATEIVRVGGQKCRSKNAGVENVASECGVDKTTAGRPPLCMLCCGDCGYVHFYSTSA